MSSPLLPAFGSGDFIRFLYVFVVPGAIIWYCRNLYIVGRPEKLSENIAVFVLFSALYAIAAGLPLREILRIYPDEYLRYTIWIAYTAILPAIVGTALGIAARKRWTYWLLALIGLKPKVPDPTGWDWIFSRLRAPVYLLVTLEDDSKVAGFFGLDSIASSDPQERDLYIEEIYDLTRAGRWKQRKEKQAILIPGKRIRHVEIWNAPTTQ